MAIEIISTDEVRFELEATGIGTRLLAYLVDISIKYGFILLMLMIGILVKPTLPQKFLKLKLNLMLLLTIGFMIIQWGYFWLFEWLWKGRTPGKRVIGIITVKDDGRSIGMVESAVRNILRYLDLSGIGLLLMFLSPKGKRIGDVVAGTVVIYERSLKLDEYDSINRTTGNASHPVQIPYREFELISDFIRRRDSLAPEARRQLAARLAELVKPRLAKAAIDTPQNPEAAIELAFRNAKVVKS